MAKTSSEVADPGLTEAGQARIEWADEQMPVLRQVRQRFERERPLDGLVVGACLHVTAETAGLVRTLLAGGAEVALCASNPLSTQDDVAAALVDHHGAEVFAIQGEDPETYYRHIEAVCDKRPQVTLDDGADLISVLHGSRSDQLPDILGGTENTTTGAIRVRALEAQGKLAFPVVVVNEAATGRMLDNEIDMAGLQKTEGIERINIKPQVDEWVFPDGHAILVLSEGRLLNLGNATGHPSFVMSNSFTNQTIAQIELFNKHEEYDKQVYVLSKKLDEKVARLHLDALGARLTELSPEQAAYIDVPVEGPYKSDQYRY